MRAASTLRIATDGATGSITVETDRNTLVCIKQRGARNVAPTSMRGHCATQYVACSGRVGAVLAPRRVGGQRPRLRRRSTPALIRVETAASRFRKVRP